MEPNNSFRKYCVLWGNSNDRDIQGEYFDEDTDFGTSFDDPQEFPIVSIDDSSSSPKFIGKALLYKDKKGLYVEGDLKETYRYKVPTLDLLDMGKMTATTWADEDKLASYGQHVDEDGRIKYWPVKQILLTSTPVDIRLYKAETIA